MVSFEQLLLVVLLLVIFGCVRTRPQSYDADADHKQGDDEKLVIHAHNNPHGTSMFKLAINGMLVVAHTNPTRYGKTYRVPLGDDRVANVSIVLLGPGITFKKIMLRGQEIRRRFVYAGNDMQAISTTTKPRGPNEFVFNQTGVYVYVP